jgi:hypothetical protein
VNVPNDEADREYGDGMECTVEPGDEMTEDDLDEFDPADPPTGFDRAFKAGSVTGTFHDRGDGYCQHCGRTIGWHAGNQCFRRDATGMPAPVPVDRQLELLADSNWCYRP